MRAITMLSTPAVCFMHPSKFSSSESPPVLVCQCVCMRVCVCMYMYVYVCIYVCMSVVVVVCVGCFQIEWREVVCELWCMDVCSFRVSRWVYKCAGV